jgi:murein L,D-transpeptidase YcbB/YkuD
MGDIVMDLLALPLLIKLIQLAFPQIGAAIGAGIPIVNAVANAPPGLLPLLEQIGRLVFPQFSGINAQAAAGTMIFNSARTAALQANLNTLGAAPPLVVDGIYGPATKKAVADFQRTHGLDVDGWAGHVTTPAIEATIAAARRT